MKVHDLYLNNLDFNNTASYGTLRQHNFTSTSAVTSNCSTLLDDKGLGRVLTYNLNSTKFDSRLALPSNALSIVDLFDKFGTENSFPMYSSLLLPQRQQMIDKHTDDKHPSNALKYNLSYGIFAGTTLDNAYLKDYLLKGVLSSQNPNMLFINNLLNKGVDYSFKDNKSSNMQFISSEKNVRSLTPLTLGKTNHNFTSSTNNLVSTAASLTNLTPLINQVDLFNKVNLN